MKQNKQVKKQDKTNNKAVKNYSAEVDKKVNKKLVDSKKNIKTSNDKTISQFDKIKILVAVVLLGLSIFAGHYFKTPNSIFPAGNSLLAYVCPVVGVVLFLVIVFYWCSFGRGLINYVKEATVELKKIVWPDRKTATRMTLMVVFFVFILALYMWLSDTFIQWLLYDLILKR